MLLFFTAVVTTVFLVGLWVARVSHSAVERAAADQNLAGDRKAQLREAEHDIGRACGGLRGPSCGRQHPARRAP